MRKDRVYKIEMQLDESSDVRGARCGCPAGKGPNISCKHNIIAALLCLCHRFQSSWCSQTCQHCRKWDLKWQHCVHSSCSRWGDDYHFQRRSYSQWVMQCVNMYKKSPESSHHLWTGFLFKLTRLHTQFVVDFWYKGRRHLLSVFVSEAIWSSSSCISLGETKRVDSMKKYQEFMIRNGHNGLTMHPCGFIIHCSKGWLGVLPYARVFYPSCKLDGIAEFKCPYATWNNSPHEACADTSFFCEFINRWIRLKSHHHYYQVQLQLYVISNTYSFCDLCVYTPIDIAAERIYPCKEWDAKCIPKLEDYLW